MTQRSPHETVLEALQRSEGRLLGLARLDARGVVVSADASLAPVLGAQAAGTPLEVVLPFLVGDAGWQQCLDTHGAGLLEDPLAPTVRGVAVAPMGDGFLAALIGQPLTTRAFDSTPAAVLVTSPDGIVRAANEGARVLFQASPIGVAVSDLLPADPASAIVGEVLTGGARTRVTSFEWERPEGVRQFELRCQRTDELCVLVLQDVTEARQFAAEREQLLEAVHQAQKLDAIGQLASGVAHDMNNVLAVVQTCAGALRDEVKEALHKADAEQILLATQRARDLLHQLLAFSRKEPARTERFDAIELAREAASFVTRLLPRTIRFSVRLPPGACDVVGDRSQLQQALINICLNGRDAMPSGGSLTLSGTFDERRVAFAVTDSGSGMPPEVMQRAFEPFFTTKKRGSGTGLGLSMAYTSLRAHHGDIRLESRPGEGTRVSLWLPRHGVVSTDVDAVTPIEATRGLALVVDDDEATRRVLGRFLKKLGYVVQLVASGEEAIAAMRRGLQPRLVVCDLVMPGLDGSQTMSKLRAIEPSVNVILTSGFVDDTDQVVKASGATALLRKPFSMDDVAQALAASGV